MKILIDMDGVLYDLSTPWYAAHNKDYPDTPLSNEIVKQFDTSIYTRAGKKVYDYFELPELWTDGEIIDKDSIEITKLWQSSGHELAICTTCLSNAAIQHKPIYAKKNFPHIKNIIMVTGDIKHWFNADILIDDGLHNHEKFEGISILYDQPWNRSDNKLPRAYNWKQVNEMVLYADYLLKRGYSIRGINYALKEFRFKDG